MTTAKLPLLLLLLLLGMLRIQALAAAAWMVQKRGFVVLAAATRRPRAISRIESSPLYVAQRTASAASHWRRHGPLKAARKDRLSEGNCETPIETSQQQQPPSMATILSQWCQTPLFGATLLLFTWSLWCTPLSNAATEAESSPDSTSVIRKQPYWTTMNEGTVEERIAANTALIDYAVGTVNTMYYDVSGGVDFQPRDFYNTFRWWLKEQETKDVSSSHHALATRDGAVQALKWLLKDCLDDPYSTYLTREELRAELTMSNEGFLGLGALVEAPSAKIQTFLYGPTQQPPLLSTTSTSLTTMSSTAGTGTHYQHHHQQYHAHSSKSTWMEPAAAQALPVVLAVTPNSPAERSGLVVGDRIVAVGSDSFVGLDTDAVTTKLHSKYRAENYLGHATLVVAKPLYARYVVSSSLSSSGNALNDMDATLTENGVLEADSVETLPYRNVLCGYRTTRVRLPTVAAAESIPTAAVLSVVNDDNTPNSHQARLGGNAVVQYALLTAQSSIFDVGDAQLDVVASSSPVVDNGSNPGSGERGGVGYIRLTRFSRASTASYLAAVEALEAAGASAYIIDLRNNYGGVIQEAMLTASTLLRDPHAVLCYTMNSRGGFTPHDVEEYVVDHRYPGYLLSRESPLTTLQQVQRENPQLLEPDGWSPKSSFASLHEQRITRGSIHRDGTTTDWTSTRAIVKQSDLTSTLEPLAAQKNLVLLINEGTASSAEVFASALRDNGRTVALVGSKTYGKGLVQHTFPLPDGGGLRLTVAEYLTPALKHVTHVGGAQFDRTTGEWIGGGLRPDMECDSRQGIPSNVGADFCVGMALDALEEASNDESEAARRTGARAITVGIVKVRLHNLFKK
jgi:C-terminal processing protease CtpA/Prc